MIKFNAAVVFPWWPVSITNMIRGKYWGVYSIHKFQITGSVPPFLTSMIGNDSCIVVMQCMLISSDILSPLYFTSSLSVWSYVTYVNYILSH